MKKVISLIIFISLKVQCFLNINYIRSAVVSSFISPRCSIARCSGLSGAGASRVLLAQILKRLMPCSDKIDYNKRRKQPKCLDIDINLRAFKKLAGDFRKVYHSPQISFHVVTCIYLHITKYKDCKAIMVKIA